MSCGSAEAAQSKGHMGLNISTCSSTVALLLKVCEPKREINNLHQLLECVTNLSGFDEHHRSLMLFYLLQGTNCYPQHKMHYAYPSFTAKR